VDAEVADAYDRRERELDDLAGVVIQSDDVTAAAIELEAGTVTIGCSTSSPDPVSAMAGVVLAVERAFSTFGAPHGGVERADVVRG
jgi:hypothetical protein